MKTLISLFMLSLYCLVSLAQAPQAFKYQAVARDNSGNVLAGKNVNFRISILQGSVTGVVVYSELQAKTTNAFGLVDMEIGKGSSPTGDFSAINWGNNTCFVKVEMDPNGGTAYQNMGTSQLLSVPYALDAKNAENGFAPVYSDADKRPVMDVNGNFSFGKPKYTEWAKLQVNGPTIVLPGQDSWGTTLLMDASALSGGDSYSLNSLTDKSGEGAGKFLIRNSTNTSSFIMDNSGRVGIGLPNPAYKLDVKGDINFTGSLYKNGSLFGGGANWSDITGKPTTLKGYGITDADTSNTNEIQELFLSGTMLTLDKGGGSVILPTSGTGGDNWGTQVVKTNSTLTGKGTDASPLGVVSSEIQPEWSKIMGKPSGFADNIDNVDDADNDLNNEIQALSLNGSQLTLSKNGGTVTLPSSGTGGDNWGTQVVKTNTTLTGQGTDASPLGVVQNVLTPSWANILNIPAGFADGIDHVDDADHSTANEIQTLSIAGNNLSLSPGGGTVVIPGDNWGTQTAVTNSTLTGNGTVSTPLGIADNGVTSPKILDNAIVTADIANDAVTSAKIQDASIVTADLANNSVTVAKLPSGAASDKFLRGDGTWTVPEGGSGSAWNLTGNSGTSPATNFVGTTDNVPLKFRTNNVSSGIIDPSAQNTALGVNVLINTTSGNGNTAFGAQALASNTTGKSNAAVGRYSLFKNTTRSNLVAVGDSALYNNGTGASAADDATRNTAIGSKSMYSNTNGNYNTAVGFQSLFSNTSAYNNVAVGARALHTNSTGFNNTATGTFSLSGNTTGYNNTTLGVWSLPNNTTADLNTSLGAYSMFYNNTGNSNTAVGNNTLHNNTIQSNLVAMGDSALYNNGTGASGTTQASRNTAVGSKSMYSNTTGYYNTSLGYQALYANSSGSSNTALGLQAMYGNTGGANNTAGGYQAMYYNSGGLNNVSYGYQSLYHNTTGHNNTALGANTLFSNKANSRSVAVGFNAMYYADDQTTGRETYNIAVGYEALRGNATASLNSGQNNIAIGDQAMRVNSSGRNNTVIGNQALFLNSGGNYNVAAGYQALYNNYSGYENNAFGMMALFSNTSGYGNTAVGRQALHSNQSGNLNVAVGHYSAYSIISTSYNTCVGVEAGDDYTYTSGTFLGYRANPTVTGLSNCMALGNQATVNASNKVVIGNGSVTSIGGYANWSNFSDGRFKKNIREEVPGLAFIRKLRPVTYNLDIQSLNADMEKNKSSVTHEGEIKQEPSAEDVEGIRAKEKTVYTGFIAQEVEAAAKSIGFNFSGVDTPANSNGYYNLRYADFVVPLVKGLQEQQVIIDRQQKQIESLHQENEKLKSLIQNLQKKVELIEMRFTMGEKKGDF